LRREYRVYRKRHGRAPSSIPKWRRWQNSARSR
jgi:hypothetical protein